MAGIIILFGERKLADFFPSFCGFGSYESTIVIFSNTLDALMGHSKEIKLVGRLSSLLPRTLRLRSWTHDLASSGVGALNR